MPVVTVSRMFGAGGSEVASRVALALGWRLLDNAIVEQVASELGASRADVEAREERVSGMTQRLADALAFGSPEILPLLGDSATLPPSEERVLEATRRVIDDAVAQGPAVVVGRGAQYLIGTREDALHVLCYAPTETLVRRAMERRGVDRSEAERLVAGINHDREQFVRRHWGRAWREAANYDLCVNTGWLGIDGASALVVSAARILFRTEPLP